MSRRLILGTGGGGIVGSNPRGESPTTSVFYTDPGITEDVGVDLWPNAGLGNDFTQAVTSAQPTLAVGVIGDGSNDFEASTSLLSDCFNASAGTIIAAAQWDGPNAAGNFFSDSGGNFKIERTASGTLQVTLFDGATKITPAVAVASGAAFIVSSKFDGVTLRMRVNGGTFQDVAAGPISFLTGVQRLLGRIDFWSGPLLDLSTWDTTKSDGFISDVEAFLDDEYSLGVL